MYRQTIAGLGLSIEEGTDGVPGDGRYYVVEVGSAGRGYRTLRDAHRRYEARKAELQTLATTAGGAE
jgi:hypothetical protein